VVPGAGLDYAEKLKTPCLYWESNINCPLTSAFNVSHGRFACGFSYTFPSTLTMEAICSSETSVTTATRCHIPEDCFLHNNFRCIFRHVLCKFRKLHSNPYIRSFLQLKSSCFAPFDITSILQEDQIKFYSTKKITYQ
jgi:hypothetical protein